MIEEKYKEIVWILTEGNFDLGPNTDRLAKTMFIIGFAESYYYLMDILKSDETKESIKDKIQSIAKEINEGMAECHQTVESNRNGK